MHIPDGVLPATVCIAGYAVTAAGTAYSLRQIGKKADPRESLPKASLFTAAFFVASWIHIPVPPTSVHLLLVGLMGAVLGYYAFPAILIGLFFQAVMFQHGGLTTLGVNTMMFGIPALAAYQIFRLHKAIAKNHFQPGVFGFFGFLAGFLGVLMVVLIAVAILLPSIPAYMDAAAERTAILAIALAHVPIMFIEGLLTAGVVTFLWRVKPEVLEEDVRPDDPTPQQSIPAVAEG